MKIIRDTREKVGYWDFSFYGHEEHISKLDTGDYSLIGYEHIICIERKKSVYEIAINVGKDSKRFEAELERMKEFKYKYLILEFSVADLLSNKIIPNMKTKTGKPIRIRGPWVLSRLNDYEKDYEIDVIFAGSKDGAMEVALEIFGEVLNDR